MNFQTISTYLSSPRLRRLSWEGGWIVVGQIAAVLGSLVLVRVLTERLEPAEYGQLALGLTIATLVNQVVMGGVTAGIGRFYSIAAEKHDLAGYLHSSRNLLLYSTAVVCAIAALLLFGLRFLGYTHWMGLAAAALVFSVLTGYNMSLNGIQNAARQRAVVAFHGGLNAWLKIAMAVGIILWLGASSTSVIIAYAASSLLVTGSQLFYLRRLTRVRAASSKRGINWLPQIWRYAWPFSTWGIFTWAQQVSDRWALQSFSSPEDVGLYAVVFQLGYVPIGLASGIMMTFLGPILYQHSGNASDHSRNKVVHVAAWRITVLVFTLTLIALAITLATHKFIFSVLVAEKYHSVSHLLPWVILAGGLFATGQMLALKLLSEMKSVAMTTAKIVTALLGVTLNVYSASRFGVSGVVASLLAFSTVYLCWMIWLAQHPPAILQNLSSQHNKYS